MKPAQPGSAFVPCRRADLERIFSLQWQRTVNRNNPVSFQNLHLQIEPVRWRATLAGCTLTLHQHLDGTLSLRYGPHCVGRYDRYRLPAARSQTAASKALSREGEPPPSPATPSPKTNPSAVSARLSL